MPALKQKRICAFGHTYYKSSDCPVCPECERLSKPESGFLTAVPAPARRALQRKGIGSLNQLAEFSKKEIAALHGMGPKALQILENLLNASHLNFN